MHTSAKFEGRARKGIEEMSVRSIVVLHGEVGKDFCPNFLEPFLENTNRMSRNGGGQKLIPVLHEPMMPIFLTRLFRLHAPVVQ